MPLTIPPRAVIERALTDAGIPVLSVSMGDPSNRATWSARYAAFATPAQRTQGDGMLATVDPQDPTLLAEIRADYATDRFADEALHAVVQGLYEAIPTPTVTLAQLRTRIVTIYRGLL